MTRRVDAVTYILRLIALVLAVILNCLLIASAIQLDDPPDRGKVIGLAVGIVILVAFGAYMVLHPPKEKGAAAATPAVNPSP